LRVGSSRFTTTGPTNWRIDHCSSKDYDIHIDVSNYSYGVADHNTFSGYMGNGAIYAEGADFAAWDSALDPGSQYWTFFEDNTLDATAALQVAMMWSGAKLEMRHNTINVSHGWVTIDNHGLWGAGGTNCIASGRGYILHDNTINVSNGRAFLFMLRGGTGLVYNNTIKTDASSAGDFEVLDYRACNAPEPNAAGACTSPSFAQYCRSSMGGEGRLCTQGIGVGANRSSEPLYAWGNTVNGSTLSPRLGSDRCSTSTDMSDLIHLGTDTVNSPKPGFVDYAYPHPLAASP
jgi:hypothetical protein